MKLYSLDKREIRSFRLRYRTLELKNFFDNKDSFGLFMMSDTLHPNERIINKKDFIQHNLKITNVSKKTASFIAKDSQWNSIKNLLKGNVILIKDRQNKNLNLTTLTYLIRNSNFSTRFLFWNQNIHREKDLLRLIDPKNNNISPITISLLIKKIALKPLTWNPFIKYINNPKGVTKLKPFKLHGHP
jgi:hypothetical protein